MSQDLRDPVVPEEAEEPAEERQEEVRAHRLPPVAYPVLGLVFGTVMVWAFSRILLATSETELEILGVTVSGKILTALIGLLMATNVLVASALVAYGQRVRRRPVSMPLIVASGLILIGGGAAANTVIGTGEGHGGGEAAQVVNLVAVGIEFDQDQLAVAPGEPVELVLENQDAGIPHNFALYQSEDATQSLFVGEIFNGVATQTYRLEPPPPGEYFFRCDVHPTTMVGTLTVAEGAEPAEGGSPGEGGQGEPGAGGEPGGEGEGGGQPGGEGAAGGGQVGAGDAVTVVAKEISFAPTELSATAEGGRVTIRLDNQDVGIPHNVAVFDGSDATGPVLFRGEIFEGPATMDYTFEAAPGTYFFLCDVHPQEMTGTLTVTG